jgi:hypothetical protein
MKRNFGRRGDEEDPRRTGRAGDHTVFLLRFREVSHHVVRPTDLERENGLQVLALEPDLNTSQQRNTAQRGQLEVKLTSHPNLADKFTARVRGVSCSFRGAEYTLATYREGSA